MGSDGDEVLKVERHVDMCFNYVSPQGLYVIHRFGAFLLLYMSHDEGYFVTNDV